MPYPHRPLPYCSSDAGASAGFSAPAGAALSLLMGRPLTEAGAGGVANSGAPLVVEGIDGMPQ